MDKFLDRFSNFFVRSVAPSAIFFVLLFFNDMYFNDSKIKDSVINITKAEDKKELPKEISLNIKNLKISDDKQQIVMTIDKLSISDNVKKSDDKSKDTDTKSNENPNINLIYIFMAFVFMAYGYVNQILTQILDNLIKSNYCLFSIFKFEICCDKKFNSLKSKVKNRLDEKEKTILDKIIFNDYNAYQVLGKEIKVSNSYVDEIKSIHTFCVALILNLLIYSFYFSLLIWYKLLFFSIILIVIFHYLAKSRYKARNKRLYINYLLKEDKKEKCEKEIKIKSIKVEVDE